MGGYPGVQRKDLHAGQVSQSRWQISLLYKEKEPPRVMCRECQPQGSHPLIFASTMSTAAGNAMGWKIC